MGVDLGTGELLSGGQRALYIAGGTAQTVGTAYGASKLGRSVFGGRPKITKPYSRPSNATTPAQRRAVQGKPCLDCGKRAPKMVANHKTPLVQEYYETGSIDMVGMRRVDAVQSQCPGCSARQGGNLSHYSKTMKRKLGL